MVLAHLWHVHRAGSSPFMACSQGWFFHPFMAWYLQGWLRPINGMFTELVLVQLWHVCTAGSGVYRVGSGPLMAFLQSWFWHIMACSHGWFQGSWGFGAQGNGTLKIQWGPSKILPEGSLELSTLTWWMCNVFLYRDPPKFALGPWKFTLHGPLDIWWKMFAESPMVLVHYGKFTGLVEAYLWLACLEGWF